MNPVSRRITFVLPGDGRSGGVRVTAIMAGLLADRGHRVRIVLPRKKQSFRGFLSSLRGLGKRKSGGAPGFLHIFKGPTETYSDINSLTFEDSEIVIAVGTYTVADVRRIKAPVTKVRFNHGFPAKPTAEQEAAWRGPMLTITVSNTLLPKLAELTEGNAWGVVPNGIDTTQYFIEENSPRDGIGALFSRHSNKAPENMIAVLRSAHEKWPHIPQHVFGTEPCPKGLEHAHYTQLPPVETAREIYNRCKAWILTSHTEGLPGVVLEAMACGCIVVSTDNDGSLEVLRDRENGLIVPRGNPEPFIPALDELFRDPDLANRLADSAKKTVADFSWNKAADRMEEFLRHLDSTSGNNSNPIKKTHGYQNTR
jgi:glycosyltransferase involved in cell wall biosynthesis